MTAGRYEVVVFRQGNWHLDGITAKEERARKDAETIHKMFGYPTYVESPEGEIVAHYGLEK